ncbi:MAG: ABC transporter permease [Candidatus Odinarchaeia archaeon]
MSNNISTIFWREAIKVRRSKSQLLSSMIQPFLWMALYGIGMSSFIGGITSIPGGFNYFSMLVIGVVTLSVLFTSLFGGISILFDKIFGLIKEVAVAPVSRTDILVGKALGVQLRVLIQIVVVFITGLLLGATFVYPYSAPIAYLGAIALVVLMSLGFVFISSMIALRLSSFEGLNAILSLLTMPFFFTSGALFPVPSMPLPLQVFALMNPVTYALEGMKALFLPYQPGISLLVPELMIPLSFAVLTAFVIVFLLLSLVMFKRTTLI